MPKARAHKAHQIQRPPPESPAPTTTGEPKWSKWCGGVLTILSFVVASLFFWPRLTIDGGTEIDPSDARPSFTITNIGFTPLHNVRPGIGFCGIGMQKDAAGRLAISIGPCNGAPLQGPIAYSKWFAKSLDKDEKYEIRLDASAPTSNDGLLFLGDTKLTSIEVVWIIEYEPWILPIPCKKKFRFVTRTERDGKLSLMPEPVEQ
jgi:hypothetical protein